MLVVPDLISSNHIEHFSALAGVESDSITIVHVDHLLSDDALIDDEFVSHLKMNIGADLANWSLFPCVHTKGVAELGSALGLPSAPGDEFARQHGVDLLNLKSTFRRLAAGVAVPLPPGSVARSPAELGRAITSTIPATGMVIAKQDRSGGGHGNVGLATIGGASLPGTRSSRFIDSSNMDAIANELWHELSDEFNSLIVVESYVPARHRFYLEFHVTDAHISFLNGGMIRYSVQPEGVVSRDVMAKSPRWIGLDLQLVLGNRTHAEVVGHARKFLDLIQRIGYRGFVNIDGLVSVDGQIFFHEINARWGGSLVYHEVGTRLLGSDYADHFLVSSALGTDPVPFHELISLIDEAGLAFDQSSLTGVLPLGGNSDLSGGTESVVIGRDAREVLDLKNRLNSCIASRIRPAGC